jgi:threonyl-tRNA synthetase
MIKLRKQIGAFRLKSTAEIRKHVYFENLPNHILVYGLKNVKSYGNYDHVRVFFNPTGQVVYHRLEEYSDLIANEAGLIGGLKVQSLTINPHTMVVIGK